MMQSDETKPPAESANPAAEPASVLAGDQQPVDPSIETKPPAESANPTAEPVSVLTGNQRPIDPKHADDVLTRGVAKSQEADREVLAASSRYTRRAFIASGIAAAAGYAGYHELSHAPREDMQPWPFQKAFQFNAALARDTFRNLPSAPTYSLSKAETLRVNGIYGLKMQLKPDSWRLQTVGVRNASRHAGYSKDVTAWTYEYETTQSGEDQGHDTKVDPKMLSSLKMAPEAMMKKAVEDENHTGRMPRGREEAGESKSTLLPGTPGLLLTMEDVLRLPRHELVTQFKCIEGWSQIVHWAGVRMVDFLDAYPPEAIDGREPKFVYMETPDGDYYTGYDLRALRHPQALLVTEMMGAPLTQFHGAPLRLHMPTKYGYKQIKRIGLIAYTNDKPDDYWTKLGYDWSGSL